MPDAWQIKIRRWQLSNDYLPESPIQLRRTGDQWYILDEDGVRIGRLAKKFTPPDAAVFIRGTVFAITTRFP